MVQGRGEAANQTIWPQVARSAVDQTKMVQAEGLNSNTLDELFQTLEDWEHQLKRADIDFEELGL